MNSGYLIILLFVIIVLLKIIESIKTKRRLRREIEIKIRNEKLIYKFSEDKYIIDTIVNVIDSVEFDKYLKRYFKKRATLYDYYKIGRAFICGELNKNIKITEVRLLYNGQEEIDDDTLINLYKNAVILATHSSYIERILYLKILDLRLTKIQITNEVKK